MENLEPRIQQRIRGFSILSRFRLRAQGVGKFSRASSAGPPTSLVIKFRKSDRVGRRGLSEPREDFSRLNTYVFPCLKFGRASACVPSRWKVLSAEFRRRPTALVKKLANQIVSVAEDCLSPERTFHGCSLMHFVAPFRCSNPTAAHHQVESCNQ